MIEYSMKEGMAVYTPQKDSVLNEPLKWLVSFLHKNRDNTKNNETCDQPLYNMYDECGRINLCFGYGSDEGQAKGWVNKGIEEFILDKIPGFCELPFVKLFNTHRYGSRSGGHKDYAFYIDELEIFANEGEAGFKIYLKSKAEKIVIQNLEHYEKKVAEALGDTEVSDVIREQLVQFLGGGNLWDGIMAVSKDIVISHGSRDEYGGSGGVGIFSDVRVWYKGQTDRQEWQWRDRYDPNADRPELSINGIGEVVVTEGDGNVEIVIELKNRDSSRTTTFTFENMEVQANTTLSTEEQVKFTECFEDGVNKITDKMMRLWTKKSYMLTNKGQQSYQKPSIKQRVIHAGEGVGAFVTEEQIDHRQDDRQIRFELYVLMNGSEIRCILEDHGHEKREGSHVISIVDLTSDKVTVNTLDGIKTINLS